MPDTIERKYALTKIAPGDYLLPSNDGRTIWRIAKYTEDGSAGAIGDYWGIWRWEGEPLYSYELGAAPVDPSDWHSFEMVEGSCETRAEAIARALEIGRCPQANPTAP